METNTRQHQRALCSETAAIAMHLEAKQWKELLELSHGPHLAPTPARASA